MDKPDFAGNTDTGFLKIIAFITMLADHVGYLFFPGEIIFRLIGRIAFPLFAYCLVVGFFQTHDIKKYFFRLFVFSAVSQIPYTLCFYPETFGLSPGSEIILGGFSFSDIRLNIGFTMMLGLLGIFGIDRKKYFLTAAAVLISLLPAVEYGTYGVCFMLAAYLFAFSEKSMFACAAGLILASPVFGFLFGNGSDIQCFAAFAVFPIIAKTNTGIKIPRFINYGFYPIHLCVLAALNFLIK